MSRSPGQEAESRAGTPGAPPIEHIVESPPPPESGDPLLTAIQLQQQGRVAEAERLFRQILKVAPSHPAVLYSLAVILLNAGKPAEALEFANAGVDANPSFAPLALVQAGALQALQRRDEALAAYDRALQINPKYLEAMVNSGALLREMHRHHDALQRFRGALEVDPNHQSALGNCGILLTEFKLGPQAVATFEHLLKQNPDYPYGLGLLCFERLHLCDWTDLESTAHRITAGIRVGKKICKSLGYMAISDSAADHERCSRIFSEGQYPKRPAPLWRGEAYGHKRLRIAYVSPDLREHPVGHLMAGVIEGHDKTRFETIAISLGIDDKSRIRARMMAAFDHFIEARQMTSLHIAETMRQMEVDIAIDLAGYTSDARPDIFLHRPAPIQVNYLGYPGTMALEPYDYIIADRTVLPEEHQPWYSEKPAYLDHCYLPIASGVEVAEPQPRSAYGLPDQGFVFCAFSHDYKIHPQVFAVWMRLLVANPGSVLWLVSRNEVSQRNLRQAAEQQGVDPRRLVFASRVPKIEDHLARYRVANLFLDTWPYNAHTTASDALLAGLPVVTYQGGAFPSRVAASLLKTLGFDDLVSHSLEDYFALADGLAKYPFKLQALRARLTPKSLKGHPFLGASFTRSLEKVLLSMVPRGGTAEQSNTPSKEASPVAEADLHSGTSKLCESFNRRTPESKSCSYPAASNSSPVTVDVRESGSTPSPTSSLSRPMTKTLDIGCGPKPKNPFNATEVYGIDVRDDIDRGIFRADLVVDPIPFPDGTFDFLTAHDFLEHIPRLIYCPQRRNAFVEVMNEVWRVLKPGGLFMSFTPAYPNPAAFRDPTHVNIITDETFPAYFDNVNRWATVYGFKGAFQMLSQEWRGPHLLSIMRKVDVSHQA